MWNRLIYNKGLEPISFSVLFILVYKWWHDIMSIALNLSVLKLWRVSASRTEFKRRAGEILAFPSTHCAREKQTAVSFSATSSFSADSVEQQKSQESLLNVDVASVKFVAPVLGTLHHYLPGIRASRCLEQFHTERDPIQSDPQSVPTPGLRPSISLISATENTGSDSRGYQIL